ncbi:MAG: 16S rRNA (guanine(527)-N(7))-methyltransferase RsmG, partial [Candidatus Cloacimonadaceae bacterium]|nr:16S rRNA (guanine(527)-N(7))-methyltransferase RsmG [Candidatus Cloacimonadaceae bacterium]
KHAFLNELRELGISDPETLYDALDAYRRLLIEKNEILNLVSRQTSDEDFWYKHFLDSLLVLKCLDLSGKKVLDFGSGGGLPGIPVKLAVPGCSMVLLDSVHKKADALNEMINALGLKDCTVACARVEDYAVEVHFPIFDYVLCRAVKMEPRYEKPLFTLLAPGGKLVCYKAQNYDDIAEYDPHTLLIHDAPWGNRKLMSIRKKDLK